MVNDNLERASAEDLLNHQFTKIYEDEEGKVVFFHLNMISKKLWP